MRALSIRQPFAWLIVAGIKPVENRTWNTAYRGPLLIHAARKFDPIPIDQIEDQFGVAIDRAALQCGGIVGCVELVDVVTEHASPWFNGPFGFVLCHPRAIAFRPLAGALKMFDAPDIDAQLLP